jgi:inosine-uridine nucleoside N-ribohydrolase
MSATISRGGPGSAPRPLIIDTDPGKDDAVAVLLALAAPEELDVLMFSAAAGNVGLDRTTRNLLRLRELAGHVGIPVHAGCPRPILRTLETVPHIHGNDGLGGANLPPPAGEVADLHAVPAIIEAIRRADSPVSIACIAPLTNIAVALVMAPDIVGGIGEIVVMGGSFSGGNITPHATFNIYSDPHAAEIVFGCGAPLTMIGLDVTRNTMPTPQWCDQLRATGTPAATLVADLWREPTAFMNDACVVAYLLEPQLFHTQMYRIAIETVDPVEIGRTRIVDGDFNAAVAATIDRDGFFQLLMDRLSLPPGNFS